MFKLDIACVSDRGKLRSKNEDNFFLAGEYMPTESQSVELKKLCDGDKPMLLAVFDGMGGENYGELASFTAAEAMKNCARPIPSDYESWFSFCTELNAAVVEKSREMLTRHMGTTMVAFVVDGQRAATCNIGDSPIFGIRDGVMKQLSEDHVEKILVPGMQMKRKPKLTQNLGIDPEEFLVEPTVFTGDVQAGDIFILCSDGLTDMVSLEDIQTIAESEPNAESCARRLVDAALANGGKDNVTVMVCRII